MKNNKIQIENRINILRDELRKSMLCLDNLNNKRSKREYSLLLRINALKELL